MDVIVANLFPIDIVVEALIVLLAVGEAGNRPHESKKVVQIQIF